jgi:hypothetical protein
LKPTLKIPFFVLLYVALISIACGMIPTATPTATLPPAAESSLKSKLIGQWKVVNGGAWGDGILTFSEDGKFSIVGGLQEKDAEGIYYFTSETTIAFDLPKYQGVITLELMNDNITDMTVTTSNEIFGTIYSVKRVK